jgi:hypothetical protein
MSASKEVMGLGGMFFAADKGNGGAEGWKPTDVEANPNPDFEAGEILLREWGEAYARLPEHKRRLFIEQQEARARESLLHGL